MTTTVVNTKISEVENEIPNHNKYITTSKFDRLTALATLELKNEKVFIIFLVGNQMEYIFIPLSHYILLSYIASNFLDIKWE